MALLFFHNAGASKFPRAVQCQSVEHYGEGRPEHVCEDERLFGRCGLALVIDDL
jgi:hypothetical protein